MPSHSHPVSNYSTIPHDHLSTTKSWLQKNMLLAPTNGTTDFIVALHTDPDHAIGVIGINSLESQEIGFILSRQYWGTGIAQEALDCILGYLFRDKQMEIVTAEVEPGSGRCMKFLERQGFVIVGFKEKVWEVGGCWWDAFQLRLTRESWEERQHRPAGH